LLASIAVGYRSGRGRAGEEGGEVRRRLLYVDEGKKACGVIFLVFSFQV